MVTRDEKNTLLTSLMQAALAGNALAYRQFLTAISLDIRRFLSRRILVRDVEDVTQEILISLHKARHTYDGKRPILPWVQAIVRFRLTDYLRKYYARMEHAVEDISQWQEILPEPVTETSPAHEYLDEAVKQLPERQQKILYLMHTEGYTAKETGQKLGMKESAVKVTAHRAYKVIRAKLGK